MMEPQLAAEIRESVAKKLAEINQFTEPVQTLAVEPTPEPLPLAEEVQSKGNGNTIAVVLLALFMFLASGVGIFFMWQKNKEKAQGPAVAGKDGRDGMSPEEMKNALRPWVDSTNKRLDTLEKRADAADKRMDVLSHRQWALCIAFNNNMSIQEYTLRQSNSELADKVIWLDPDWKLLKLPAFVQLSDEDRRKLMEGIK